MVMAGNQNAGQQAQRVLLLVDDELNILTALNRLLRQDRYYHSHQATSGKEATGATGGGPGRCDRLGSAHAGHDRC